MDATTHADKPRQPGAGSDTPSVHAPSGDAVSTIVHQPTDGKETAVADERGPSALPSAAEDAWQHETPYEREKDGVEQAPPPGDDFPDGGFRAWLVVFGAVMCTTSTFGFVNSWGAFQDYYTHTLLPNNSPSDIAWIGSIQYSLTFLPSLVTGRLFDLGYFKLPLFLASVVLVGATFVIAECTQFWHFVLCQGLLIGLASGVSFGPAVSVVSHWFKRRRGLALGIVAIGSSLGGTLFPIAFRKLLPLVGFKWTMRILGFLLLFTLSITNLTLKRRLPPVKSEGGLIYLKPFREPALFLYTLGGIFCFLGLYTVLTYISVSAEASGVSSDFAFYLVSIANAASALGRVGSGLAADRLGAVTVIIPMTLLAGALTFAWPFVHTPGAFAALATVYGVGAGTFVALLVQPAIALGALGDVGRRVGTFMALLAAGALAGPPISGAILAATGGFAAVGAYAGSMVVVACVCMLASRHVVLGGWRGKF